MQTSLYYFRLSNPILDSIKDSLENLDFYMSFDAKFENGNDVTNFDMFIYLYDGVTFSFGGSSIVSEVVVDSEWHTYITGNFDIDTGLWKDLIFNKQTDLGLQIEHEDNSNWDGDEILWFDNFKVYSSYDYATHDNDGPSDTWDFEDSNEYFYDTYGNVSDFNDGTTEDWTGDSNEGNEYLKETSSSTANTIQRTGLSIDSSVYKWMTFEFNNSRDITEIRIIDSASNIVCSDTTGWTGDGTFYLFSCDLTGANWSGTETTLKITYLYSSGTQIVFLNMVYLYDVALGDIEGWPLVGFNSPYQYVNPEGYNHVVHASGSGSFLKSYTPSGLSIDTLKFKYLKFRAKTSNNANILIQAGTAAGEVTVSDGTTLAITTSWQIFTIDLSLDINWDGTATFLGIRYPSPQAGYYFDVDYFILTSDSAENDIFTIGLYDQDNSQPLLNVTQHYYDADTFQWRVYVTDSQNNVVSYYYHDENETRSAAGYAAVDSDLGVNGFTNTVNEWETTGSSPYLGSVDATNYISTAGNDYLFVNGFSSTTTEWNETGSTPYLDAVDATNYISVYNGSLIERWFTFADTTISYSSGYSTLIQMYVIAGDGDDDVTWNVDTNGDNTAECSGTLQNPTSGWYDISVSSACLDTKTEINNARISFTKVNISIVNDLQIDAARLQISHDELASNWFTFADTSSEHTTDYSTTLGIYVSSATGLDTLDWKIDITGDVSPEYSGSFSSITSGWNTIKLTGITTKTDINAARLSLTYSTPNNNTIEVDAAKLYITHTSTVDDTSCFEVYCRIKVTYNVLQSELNVELKTDGGTRIFKISYPDDFTNTGVIPTLFKHGKAPDIFFSSYTPYITSSETWLDYIEAPFKEAEWRQTTSPTELNKIITDTPRQMYVSGDVSAVQSSVYRINVPFLDSVSGRLDMNFSDMLSSVSSDYVNITFTVYGVEWDTGSLVDISHVKMTAIPETIPSGSSYSDNDLIIGNSSYDYILTDTNAEYMPAIDFSITLSNDRSIIETNSILKPWADENNTIEYKRPSEQKTVKDIIASSMTNPSQEFVLEIKYQIYINPIGVGDASLFLNGFDFLERDLFSDPIGFIVGIASDAFGGIVGLILGPLFDFLATIVRFIVSAIQAIIGPIIIVFQTVMETAISALGGLLISALVVLQSGLEAALSGLGGLFETALSSLGALLEAAISALEPLLTVISDVLDTLGEYVQAIGDYVITALIDGLTDILDALLELLTIIIDGSIAVASYLLDAFLDLLPFGIGAFIREFANLSVADVTDGFFNLLDFLLTLGGYVAVLTALFLTAYIWFLPFANNGFEPGPSIDQMLRNGLNMHGVDFNTAIGTLPIRVNAVMVWLFLITLLGWINWIMPFSLY